MAEKILIKTSKPVHISDLGGFLSKYLGESRGESYYDRYFGGDVDNIAYTVRSYPYGQVNSTQFEIISGEKAPKLDKAVLEKAIESSWDEIIPDTAKMFSRRAQKSKVKG